MVKLSLPKNIFFSVHVPMHYAFFCGWGDDQKRIGAPPFLGLSKKKEFGGGEGQKNVRGMVKFSSFFRGGVKKFNV